MGEIWQSGEAAWHRGRGRAAGLRAQSHEQDWAKLQAGCEWWEGAGGIPVSHRPLERFLSHSLQNQAAKPWKSQFYCRLPEQMSSAGGLQGECYRGALGFGWAVYKTWLL